MTISGAPAYERDTYLKKDAGAVNSSSHRSAALRGSGRALHAPALLEAGAITVCLTARLLGLGGT